MTTKEFSNSKRRAEFFHSKKRLRERYEETFTPELEKDLLNILACEPQNYVLLEKESHARKIFLIRFNGKEYVIVKKKNAGCVTFLDRSWYPHTFEEYHQERTKISDEKEQVGRKKIQDVNDELYKHFGLDKQNS